jgi:hypothetical protein
MFHGVVLHRRCFYFTASAGGLVGRRNHARNVIPFVVYGPECGNGKVWCSIKNDAHCLFFLVKVKKIPDMPGKSGIFCFLAF